MPFKRLFLGLFALLVAASCLAASVADRSPFAQGHWWDPSRPGAGFDIFSAGGQIMVIWYTYEESGRPVWYTAQGDASGLGGANWPLLKHRWTDGRKGEAIRVGQLRMEPRHAESALITWTLGSQSGNLSAVPFVVSGMMNEVDHSGSWFDPAHSGWGLNVTEQGDVLGGVLFTYDASGAPTWAAGFGRERGAVELFAFQGACPSCQYSPSTSRSVGRLGLDFTQEWELTARNRLSLTMAPGIEVEGARMVQLSTPASMRLADRQLASFPTAAGLKQYLDAGMLNARSSPAGADFSPAPAGTATAYSPTNLIEGGVDEAALVKTDGRHIYTFGFTNNVRQPVVRIAQVGDDGASVSVRGSVALASGPSTPMQQAGLFLHGGQLTTVSGAQVYAYWYGGGWTRGTTNVEIMSLASAESPATRWRAQIDGYLVSSRRIGDRLYIVSRYVPHLQGFFYGASSPASVTSNMDLLARTTLADLLPKVRVNGGEATEAVQVSSVYVPPQGARPPSADMILVTAIDLAQARVAQTIAIVGTPETIYASTEHLFVATSRYVNRNSSGGLLPVEPSTYITDIHQIRLGATTMDVVASGSIEGFLSFDQDQAPFRMSEHQGKLRVVSSSSSWWQNTRNRLTILQPSVLSPGILTTVSFLPNAQRPETLGKPGEFLYATRFVGDRLYAVTFRQVDPLYVIDISNAADPRITGALEVPGFSEYLHPLANGLLLGFGREATEFGLLEGLQLSLYDVSDAGKPRQLQKAVIGKRGSDSALLKHHHAFSARPQADGSIAVAIPARIHDGAPSSPGGFASYSWQQSGLLRYEVRGSSPANASLVQMGSLITHTASNHGQAYFVDPGADGGRSILFPAGTVYVGNGQFWRQDLAGNTFGPF